MLPLMRSPAACGRIAAPAGPPAQPGHCAKMDGAHLRKEVIPCQKSSLASANIGGAEGRMRMLGLFLMVCLVTGAALAQGAGAISSPALSRCAGLVGSETRAGDPAFVSLALDGVPWLAIERTDDTRGSQAISTTVTGTGYERRRDGTAVPFRFTCVLDFRGEALIFHASPLMRRLGDELPPALIVEGGATYLEKMPLPKGIELQVQLLDVSKSSAGEILAE